MNNKFLCRFSAFLCLVLLLSACTDRLALVGNTSEVASSATVEDEPVQRRTIAFSDMVYARPDIEGVKAEIISLTEALAEAEDFEEVVALDDACMEATEPFYTAYTLATIHNDIDPTDAFFEGEVVVFDEASVDIALLISRFNTLLVEGPYADAYRGYVGDYLFEDIQNSLLFYQDNVTDLIKAREALQNDYGNAFATFTIEDNGTNYTISEIGNFPSYEQVQLLENRYYSQYRDFYAELLADLIATDSQVAKNLGFSSVADMYYQSYGRDYTPEDALAACERVKETFVPLLADFYYLPAEGEDWSLPYMMKKIPSALSSLDSELPVIWQYMLDYSLYDIADTTVKPDYGYTTYLDAYDAPFLYSKYTDDSYSFSTLVHEFGHFSDFYIHYDDLFAYTLDTSETLAMGMEMLMAEEYELFFDDAEAVRLTRLQDVVYTIVFQAALEEFQLRLYSLPLHNAETIGTLYTEVLSEYGLGPLLSSSILSADSSWLKVIHIFEVPFYTISYVASSVSALQLAGLSATSRESATEAYLTLLYADQNQSYTSFLATAGLVPFTDETILYELERMLRATLEPSQVAAAA